MSKDLHPASKNGCFTLLEVKLENVARSGEASDYSHLQPLIWIQCSECGALTLINHCLNQETQRNHLNEFLQADLPKEALVTDGVDYLFGP